MVHPMRFLKTVCLGLLLVCAAASAAPAADAPRVRLTTATELAGRGRQERVAFHFAIAPGWHLYWKNPGVTGLPTQLRWTLPRGVEAGPLDWPVPERFEDGGLVNYGYAREVTLLAPLSLPASGIASSAHAEASWLLCAQMCVPGRASVAVPLGRASGDRALFDKAGRAMPRDFGGLARVAVTGGHVTLVLGGGIVDGAPVEAVSFFPAVQRVVDDAAPPQVTRRGDGIQLRFKRSRHPHPLTAFSGVLKIAGRGAWTVRASPAATLGARAEPRPSGGFALAILFAFLGGLILNLMPCVLPVLSMKALAFAQARESAAELREEGIAYFAGVFASFGIAAGALLALRAAGAGIGWGFQLQSPAIVALLALLCAGVGLNFLGVFEVPAALAGVGSGLTMAQSAHRRAFFTGVLAVLVASPCTAPFMGTAMGFALTQPAPIGLAVFAALATGFALPFTALAFLPGLVHLIPRPGRWMIVLKEFLAFPMFATAVWLVWVVAQQAGAAGVAITLGAGAGLGFLGWLFSRVARGALRSMGWFGAAAVLALMVMVLPASSAHRPPRADGAWQPWSRAALAAAHAEGRPVFVDFGAAWCVTCLINERVVLDDARVRADFAKKSVVALKGDWTNRDPGIANILSAYGRAGVPLYLVFPAAPGSHAVVLPQILTTSAVLSALQGPAAPASGGR
jgi:thiol:disulfide interchange protein DsbD